MTNCPNCGAPLTGHKCEYCGAIIFDFAAFQIGKPVWLNIRTDGGTYILTHVMPDSVTVKIDPDEEALLYADNEIYHRVHSTSFPRIALEFTEIPTDKGITNIISKRGVVPSTDLEV